MRIALSGASGTGKSTIARALSEHYKIPICPIGSREVAKDMGFDNPYDVDAAGKRAEFQQRLFEMKREWEAEHEHFVTDRSYFDNLAYSAMHCPTSGTIDIEQYFNAMNRYETVFVFSLSQFQDLSDPVRVQSQQYHFFYETLLMGFFRYDMNRDMKPQLIRRFYPHFITTEGAQNRLVRIRSVIEDDPTIPAGTP